MARNSAQKAVQVKYTQLTKAANKADSGMLKHITQTIYHNATVAPHRAKGASMTQAQKMSIRSFKAKHPGRTPNQAIKKG